MSSSFMNDGSAARRPLVVGAVVTASAGVLTWLFVRARKARRLVLANSSEVSVQDLLDPDKRANHVEWNNSLHKSKKSVIPVTGANELYVVIGHQQVLELSQDHRLSSNPYSDERLIALNTMSDERHSAVSKILHRFYQHREMRRLEAEFFKTASVEFESSMNCVGFDVMPWAKKVHMANTLKILLGDLAPSSSLVDDLIRFNDDMVTLVAPLGGVGRPCPPFWSSNTLRVVRGLFVALPSTLRFLWKAGFSGLRILRPDKTLARSDVGSGVWHYPELLLQVPRYFTVLLRLWDLAPLNASPTSPMEALKVAVGLGQISLAEALVTVVQLMVNMTSANALGNLVMRFCTEKQPPSSSIADLDAFVSEVLRLDAPLQRNPRRVLEDIEVDGVHMSAGASVLLFIGAANVDPNFYESPACFMPSRKESTLTFGAGVHYCLGSYLVKAEMREALRYLMQHSGSFQLEHCERVCNVDVGNYGFESLYLRVEKYK